MTPWEIKAKEFANCNCSYGCPCQFNALPTHGFCEAAVALEIEEGQYGEVKLDGLRMGGIFQWPGPVHEGHGKCQPFVDERADGEQREALLKIMSGQDTEPMATMFAVFSSTLEKVYDPIFAKIDFNVDVEGRRGRYASIVYKDADRPQLGVGTCHHSRHRVGIGDICLECNGPPARCGNFARGCFRLLNPPLHVADRIHIVADSIAIALA